MILKSKEKLYQKLYETCDDYETLDDEVFIIERQIKQMIRARKKNTSELSMISEEV